MSKGSMHLKCFLSITGGQGIDLVKNASKRQISAFAQLRVPNYLSVRAFNAPTLND